MTLREWLAERERKASAATKGPWWWDFAEGLRAGVEASGYPNHYVAVSTKKDSPSAVENMEFIADARESLPRLVEMVRVMREALPKCRELFSDIRGDWSDPRSRCRQGWAVIDEALERVEAIAAGEKGAGE